MAAGGEPAPAPAPASGPPPTGPAGLLLRPLVFVVDAVRPVDGAPRDVDDGAEPGEHDAEEASLYDEFLAALRDGGRDGEGGRHGGGNGDDASVAASYASR